MSPSTSRLASDLEQLGFTESDGLVSADTGEQVGARGYHWRDLRDRVQLDAAFFRDGVPVVGFIDLTRPAANLSDLRKRLWNYGRLPFLIASSKSDLAIYNGLDYLDENAPAQALDRIPRTSRALASHFHRAEVESGRLLATYAPQLRASRRADATLLRNLRYLRTTLGTSDGRRTSVDALIGASLLTSYLADRNVLQDRHFRQLAGVSHLHEALDGGSATSQLLFSGLAEHFNGDVFGALAERLSDLKDADFERVSCLLKGDELSSGQTSLWPYDFAVLPSDLVSSIYEQLLDETQKADAAFYTPHTLVDIALDEVLPWEATLETPSIIDLACGSGAFITSAFRRLAFRQHTHAAPAPYEILRDSLQNHIFGVDSNPIAARVAAFGLYLALLEEVDPPTVWDHVILPALIGTNVVCSDAFDEHVLSDRQFDVVVGNPPWKRGLSLAAEKFLADAGRQIADNQLALAFVWLAEKRLAQSGRMALVLPAKNVLHNHSPSADDFRQAMFGALQVTALMDLSAIRRTLFAGAIAPTVVLIATKRETNLESTEPESRDLTYVAVHPHADQAPAGPLVIDPENIVGVSAEAIARNPRIWRTLLWGSLRDVELIEHLRGRFPSANEVARERGWEASQGYQTGKDSNDASDLLGLPIIETTDLGVLTIESAQVPFDIPYLHRPRSRRLYAAPHAIFSRTIRNRSDICAALLDFDAVHPAGTVGVSCLDTDRVLLATLTAATVSNLGKYWHFFTSAQWGVERDAIERNDIMSLPFAVPSNKQGKKLELLVAQASSGNAKALDKLDDLIYEIYDIDGLERIRLEDSLETALRIFHSRSTTTASVSTAQLHLFQSTISQALTGLLPELQVTTLADAGGLYVTVAVTIIPPGKDASVPEFRTNVVEFQTQSTPMTRSTGFTARPSGFFVDQDTIYIVKSSHWERWTIDAALSDADRILASLLAAD